jgi:hypothetical protein
MSALPPKADMVQRRANVRFVPKADIHWDSAVLATKAIYWARRAF